MTAPPSPDAPFATFALIALLALVCAALAWWLRSRGTLGLEQPIRLVAVRGMGGKRLLAVVEVERQRFLLGLTDAQIACLARLPSDAAAAPEASSGEETWVRQSA